MLYAKLQTKQGVSCFNQNCKRCEEGHALCKASKEARTVMFYANLQTKQGRPCFYAKLQKKHGRPFFMQSLKRSKEDHAFFCIVNEASQ